MAKVVKAAKAFPKGMFPDSLAKKRHLGKKKAGGKKSGVPATAKTDQSEGMGMLMKSGSENKKIKKLSRMKKGAKLKGGPTNRPH